MIQRSLQRLLRIKKGAESSSMVTVYIGGMKEVVEVTGPVDSSPIYHLYHSLRAMILWKNSIHRLENFQQHVRKSRPSIRSYSRYQRKFFLRTRSYFKKMSWLRPTFPSSALEWVSLALVRFTSLFGMGRGGSKPLKQPGQALLYQIVYN